MNNIDSIVQPEKSNILDLFRGSEYIIPIYQRNYAWEEKEIEQLLDDIKDSTGDYYLGSLIVNKESSDCFEVVDGQQRLTTLYLLLAFLNNESVKINSLRFESRERSNMTLEKIYELDGGSFVLKEDVWYSEEIINGYNVIEKYFEKNDKSSFFEKLRSIYIFRIQVPQGIDLNHYFEVMNTRGEQLELHEVLKGKILKKIDNADDRILAAAIWDNCAQMEKYIQMCFKTTQREELFGEDWNSFKVNSFEDIKNKLKETGNGIDEFILIDKLENPVITKGKKDNKEDTEDERFESIVSFPVFLLLVNEAMSNANTDNDDDDSGLDDKRFLSLMEHHYSNNENALLFVYELLKYRFIFDKYIIKREYAKDYKKDGRWSLQRLEKYVDKNDSRKPIYKGTFNTDDNDNSETQQLRWLESCLRITYTSPKTMHWISRAMCFVNVNGGGNLTSHLETYCCKKIKTADYNNKKGFNIERIVFTYLDYVLCKKYSSKYNEFQFQFRTSIEHFYPQHPPVDDQWEYDDLNCFGNLALITVSANSRFSNLLPGSKVENYPDVITQSPKLQEMVQDMKSNGNKWERDNARKHGIKMLDLLKSEIDKHNNS